ncbi:MAG: hypothetical protein NC124_03520 [Clostridium sp.]|nr:hypothetical protein [Clostridium sp.]
MKTNKKLRTLFTLVMAFCLIFVSIIPAEAKSASYKPTKVQAVSAVRNDAGSKITITYNKVKKATGYQVAYKAGSAKKYTIKNTKKTVFTIKAGTDKAYKVKVRAYYKKFGKTYYGTWSKVQTVAEAHVHTWVTVTDSEAWDEPVYDYVWTGTTSWPDGTDCPHGCGENYNWCGLHCKRCRPNCPDPDPRGYCAQYDQIMVFEEVQVDTVHHPAVTHEECSSCGAVK